MQWGNIQKIHTFHCVLILFVRTKLKHNEMCELVEFNEITNFQVKPFRPP